MTIKKIPETHLWTCNLCELEVGHNSDTTRPSHWTRLVMYRDAHDHHDVAVANADVKLDLCGPCSGRVMTAINSVKDIGNPIK